MAISDGETPALGNRLITSLPAQEQQRLAPFLETVDFPLRAALCEAGEPIRHVVFPVDAVTSTLVDLPEGESIEVGLMGAEGMVGLDLLYGASRSLTAVVVQIAGSGLRMRADDLRREVVEPGGPFYDLLLRYSRVFFGMVAQCGACNASHGIEQRLARWLLMVHDRVRRDRFPLTHEFIALMLGVRRATVSQAASSLRNVGAIDYDRGEICVQNRQTLERAACGCYAIVREMGDSIFANA